MSTADPSTAVPVVVAYPAKNERPLTVLKYAWIVLGAILVLVTALLVLALPDRMSAWLSAMPFLSGIVVAMGAAAFGGPAIKRAQEAARVNGG